MERRLFDRRRVNVRLRRKHLAAMVVAVLVVIGGSELLSGIGGPALPPLPALVDVSGQLTIGCGFDATVSAPEVCRAGRVIGVYLDDTTPNLKYWLGLAVAKYPDGTVIVAEAPNTPTWRFGPRPPVLNCHEWYPTNEGIPIRLAEKVFPKRRWCYIIQRFYGGLATQWGAPWRPPSAAQAAFNLRQAQRQHPRLILAF